MTIHSTDFEGEAQLDKGLFTFTGTPILPKFKKQPSLMQNLHKLASTANFTPLMDDATRSSLGTWVLQWMQVDRQSRTKWELAAKAASDLVHHLNETQNSKPEDSDLEGAHHPLIAHAIIDFAARTGPALMGKGNLVKCVAPGANPTPETTTASRKLGAALSHQVMVTDAYWERGTDRILHLAPAEGMGYRRRFYDVITKQFKTEVCSALDIIVNDKIKTLEDAPRISYQYTMPLYQVRQYEAKGMFSSVPYSMISTIDDPHQDVELVEQIVRLPLIPGSSVEVPVRVTVELKSQQVIGMDAAFHFPEIDFFSDPQGMEYAIIPVLPFYTDYHFLPSPFGGFHSYGYGLLLSGINTSINSILDEIISSAANYSANGGVMSTHAGVTGNVKLDPRKINVIEATTANLKDHLVMFDSRQPPQALFAVLQLLGEAGRFLASTVNFSELSASVSATQIAAMSEQGERVASGVYRRLRVDMTREFRGLLRLNRVYRSEGYGFTFAGEDGFISREAFFMPVTLEVTSDPAMSSESAKFNRIAMFESFRDRPEVDQRELSLRILALMDIENPEKLIPPPPPNVQMQMEQEKHKLEIEQAQMAAMETLSKIQLTKAQISKVIADTERVAGQHMQDDQRLQLEQIKTQVSSIVAFEEMTLARKQLAADKEVAQRNLNGRMAA